ncbi:BamA/TamA family outer membrane protein [Flavobacterium urocaniciphilum]|uniref:Outer membrane translocation and assembly module TamA n=1 Tax=Flavobacterium urocaniciphilum TaxID=1299341 RepID=A0A1H9C6R4_9FLAO|nr:hypothetical protein [Flavobacterium urocaniciphilum]SEP96523.1 hypothetical protein SAMN05444005_10461 [Flavobacterium urocaniciphilum]
MKYFLFLVFFTPYIYSQKFHLTIEGNSAIENKTIDSLGYSKIHSDLKSLIETQNNFNEKLIRIGFLENELLETKKTNDSTFLFKYKLGTQTKKIEIHSSKIPNEIKTLLNLSDNSFIPIYDSENFLNNKLAILEKKGFAQAKIKLDNFSKTYNILQADLCIELNAIRKINNLVFKGYDQFPNGIKKVFLKKYQSKPFNQDIVKKINNDFNSLPFVKQKKYPEILLTTDSTQVYIYLEKRKNNSFDGFLGFGNNEETKKLQFNGYLDLSLFNNLNSGERFNLYWKNDGNKQSTFNVNLDLAYIFKSPLALKTNLKIFKQDTIFQNSSIDFDLGYMINYKTKAFIGYKENTSEAIQKNPSNFLKDLKATFITTTFEHKNIDFENSLFPDKFSVFTKFGLGNRTAGLTKTNQFFGQIQISRLIELNKKNYIHVKSDNFYLQSNDYFLNELYRFGGIQSIRGFNENSLIGNAFSGIFTEYRHIAASNLYLYTITDFGYFQDKASNTNNQLLGFGFGFGLLSKNGLFNLVYANGSTKNQAIKLSNSIVQISFKTNF